MKERLKIATALGYYARATDPEAAVLAKAIELHALTEYRHDIDCQIAFRKGWQKAEEHLEARGPERDELRALTKIIKDLIVEVQAARSEASLHAERSLNYISINERQNIIPRWLARDILGKFASGFLEKGLLTANQAAEILAHASEDPKASGDKPLPQTFLFGRRKDIGEPTEDPAGDPPSPPSWATRAPIALEPVEINPALIKKFKK